MKKFFVFLLLMVSNHLVGQAQYVLSEILDFYCDEEVNPSRYNTRIIKDSISSESRIIILATTATCCVNFKLTSKYSKDSIKMELTEIGEACDCICGYTFEVKIDGTYSRETKFYLHDKLLEKNIPKLIPLEKRYFIYENDTIGYDDEDGLRQGAILFKKKTGLQKVYYKDGKFIKFEILDTNGKVIITETDEDKIFDY